MFQAALRCLTCVALTSASRQQINLVAASGRANAAEVACPVLAALTTADHLRPDSMGQVPGPMVFEALMQTGADSSFAAFQTAGIVAYRQDDIHQTLRMSGPAYVGNTEPKFVNLETMNPDQKCKPGLRNTAAGYPCNTNTEYQQHAYSTTILDNNAGGTISKRFRQWFGMKGVLSRPCRGCKLEMTVAGLGRLLKYAREGGDYNGENSLNATGGLEGSNMAKFHPSVSSPEGYLPLAQWQAVLAWAGFMVAFAKERDGELYFPAADLQSFFEHKSFPRDWVMRPWGLGAIFNFVPALKGTGAGDEIIAIVEGILASVGTDAASEVYYQALLGTLAGLGAFNDQVSNQIE